MHPTLNVLRDPNVLRLRVRRTVRIKGDEEPAFTALGDLIDSAEVRREGMAATSYDVAMNKFNGSYRESGPFEHLVDLATALEAALLGGEKETEGLSLRLRTRVAALLATEADSGEALFRDVSRLYDIRSKLVHGGQIPEKELRKLINGISTVPESAKNSFVTAVDYAVDRMRDIVRRAILARLCLAAKKDAPWPFIGSTAVDASLAGDKGRAEWRQHWRSYLSELGVGYAADQPRAAVEFLSKEDR
ncbi:HEPN domain-containing protein [Nocardia sp. alder85J]|uniref:HEPN domain-containing protein n=1 Tax=Nocardia sp. alder85J TaxID=2862949 RepID=UPI001CD4F1CA|nr:HEPN domain-containing protein [Nocardia sp. alder85J]MCX4098023.1 HEPN domain-containing protein [Nocardia sp. alder85J]